MKIKKGKKLPDLLSKARAKKEALESYLKKRNASNFHRQQAYRVIKEMKRIQSEATAYLENEPVSSNAGYYKEKDYEWDKQNVRDYYTKWVREDIFNSKKSLKRIRKYEKRNNLPPFDLIEHQESEQIKIKKLEQENENT